MKLIALRPFRNQRRAIKVDGELVHPDHIHKGATFEIGGKAEFDDLSKEDQQLVSNLNGAHAIGDADNAKLVKRIQAEVAEEKAVDERTKAASRPQREAKQPVEK